MKQKSRNHEIYVIRPLDRVRSHHATDGRIIERSLGHEAHSDIGLLRHRLRNLLYNSPLRVWFRQRSDRFQVDAFCGPTPIFAVGPNRRRFASGCFRTSTQYDGETLACRIA